MLKKGGELINIRTQKKFKIGRLVRMHSNNMEDITEAQAGDIIALFGVECASAGDIIALFGVECASGDTFCHPDLNYCFWYGRASPRSIY